MFDARTDPLGIGLRSRSARYHDEFENLGRQNARAHGQIVSFANPGVLRDPMWDAFHQATMEAGVDNMADNSVGVKRGMWAPSPQVSTVDPTNPAQSSAVRGFASAAGMPMPESHDAWMGKQVGATQGRRKPLKINEQRGGTSAGR